MRISVLSLRAALCGPLAFASLALATVTSCSSTASSPRSYSTDWHAAALPASAPRRDSDEPKSFAARGFFVGGMGVAATMSNSDLDGQSGLIEPNSGLAIVLPELDPGIGWGAALGFRGKRISVQFSYTTSTHDDDFLGTSLEDDFRTYNLDFKHHWNIDGALQPYLLLGVTVPRLTISDGANLGGNIGDATLQGLGANLGGGATLYITPHLALFGEALYRVAEFDRVSALDMHPNIKGHLDASGFAVRGGLTYTF